MEECPICCEMRTLKELSKCKLQESKHKICEECHNKSNNNCWLCGDKMVTDDVKIIEIRENSNEQVRENETEVNEIKSQSKHILNIVNGLKNDLANLVVLVNKGN